MNRSLFFSHWRLDYIVFFMPCIVQVPLSQAEQAGFFMAQLLQAQLESARELTARARRVRAFMGVLWGCWR
jgi:hypothetical protein